MDNQKPSALINLILEKLDDLRWSQRQLSRASGVSSGAINNLLRGESVPETVTVEKIADALGIPRRKMLEALAGTQVVSEATIDPTALYMARRLTELPVAVRDTAIEVISGVLDSFIRLAGTEANKTNTPPIDLTMFPEADRELINILTPDFQWYLAALLNQGEQEYLKAMTYAKTRADAAIRRQSGS
jgi:transcriptional regulator with XRE-family HTH domain